MTTLRAVAQRRVLAGALALGLFGGLMPAAFAEQVLEDLDDPVTVQLQTPISSTGSKVGDEFAVTLADTLRYANWTIPSGTVIRGNVAKANSSRHFSRAGYVQLQPNTATLPNGTVYDFKPTVNDPSKKKLHHPGADTFGDTVKEQLPFTAVSLGTSIPLRVATDLPGIAVSAIALGARMTYGMIEAQWKDDYDNMGFFERTGRGAFRGTGIPRIYKFLSKEPEAVYAAGDQVPMYFNEDALEGLFQTANGTPAAYVPPAQGQQGLTTISPADIQRAEYQPAASTLAAPVETNEDAMTTPIQLEPAPAQ